MLIRHKCDVPSCVNPDHLELGDIQANSDDMVERSRQCRGERCHTAKLTEDDVIDIRTVHALGGNIYAISVAYGLTWETVRACVEGRTWKHVAGPVRLIVAVMSVAALCVLQSCNQSPIPINPSPGNNCGVGAYQECPDHGCCLAYYEECTPYHMCRYVGEGPMFGSGRDGGVRERPELTPAEAMKEAPR